MIQKDGVKNRLEYATVSINDKSFIAKEPIEFPFINIFFDVTISKNGGKQNKIHFRFKDINNNLIQVVAYYNDENKKADHWNKEVPMTRNNTLLNL